MRLTRGRAPIAERVHFDVECDGRRFGSMGQGNRTAWFYTPSMAAGESAQIAETLMMPRVANGGECALVSDVGGELARVIVEWPEAPPK